MSGRTDEARRALTEMQQLPYAAVFRAFTDFLEAWLDRSADRMVLDRSAMKGLKIQDDPEAIFTEGWLLCDIGVYERGIDSLRRAVEKGYSVAPTLARSRVFDPVRQDPAFQSVLAEAEAGRDAARRAFHDADGHRLLGLPVEAGR
jgi:hypothetical protein